MADTQDPPGARVGKKKTEKKKKTEWGDWRKTTSAKALAAKNGWQASPCGILSL